MQRQQVLIQTRNVSRSMNLNARLEMIIVELENIHYQAYALTEESVDHESQHMHSASKEFIDTLPHVKAFEESSCCICMSEVKNGENITILPCTHKFHSECVDGWLLIKPSCPVCKTRIN